MEDDPKIPASSETEERRSSDNGGDRISVAADSHTSARQENHRFRKYDPSFWDFKLKDWTSAITVALLFSQIIVYLRQVHIMRTQTKIEAGQQSDERTFNRPWIAAEISLVGPLTFSVDGAQVPVRIELKNVGHSVALNAMPNIRLFPLHSLSEIPKTQDRLCAGSNAASAKIGVGHVIFPGVRAPPVYESLTITVDQIKAGVLTLVKPGGPELLDLHVLGCISYRPPFGKTEDYQTGIAFEIAQPDPAHPGALLPIEVGKDIPLERLHLYSEFLGYGEYAK